jgi:hypothetical protein
MIFSTHEHFDNAAAANEHIDVRPVAAAMGAEIAGVDCANVGDAAFAEIEAALFRHKMIYFRGQQRMTHGDQSAFSRRFGAFAEDAHTKGVPGFPEVQPLIKEADERTGLLLGSGWHTDSAFLPEPPAISLLRSIEIPPFGGDTISANSALAYRALSPTMQGLLKGLRVHMSMGNVLESARAHAAPNDNAIGRLAQTKGMATLPDDLARRCRAVSTRSCAPTRAPANRRSTATRPMPPGSRSSGRKRLRRSSHSWPGTSPSPRSPAACAGKSGCSSCGTTGCASIKRSTTTTAISASSIAPPSPANVRFEALPGGRRGWRRARQGQRVRAGARSGAIENTTAS